MSYAKLVYLKIRYMLLKEMLLCIVNYRLIFQMCTIDEFHVHTVLNQNVGLLRLFPGITSNLVKAFLQPPIQGVVLQSYGMGNIPSNRKDIIEEFHKATKRNVIIVNITQCTTGRVTDTYEAAQLLKKAGIVCSYNSNSCSFNSDKSY